jgi:molybdate transport system ATP-binding protein
MMIKTLAAGVALAVLVSGAASAAPQSKTAMTPAASPSQPIPYSQLDAYMKASPKTRASKDWWSGSAATGASTDTSATLPPAPADTSAAPLSDGSVNPSASSLPSDSSASLPATPPTLPDSAAPDPGSNLPGSPTPGAPTEPK